MDNFFFSLIFVTDNVVDGERRSEDSEDENKTIDRGYIYFV